MRSFLLIFSSLAVLSQMALAEGLKESLASESFRCPPGTERVGDPPPDNIVLFCEKTYPGGKAMKHGPYRSWYRTGEKKGEGYYHLNKPDGTFTQFFPNGQLKQQMTFVKGVQEGEQVRFFSNGLPELRRNFLNGKLNGKSEAYYQNGNPKFDGQFLNGYPEGPILAWYSNGKRKVQGFYHKQKKSGPWVAFYDSGAKKSEGSYSGGNLDGLWTDFREDGTAKSYIRYEEGRVVKSYQGEKAVDQAGRRRRMRQDTLDELESRRFAAWDKKIQKDLKEKKRKVAEAGGEFVPIEQKAGVAWAAKRERKAKAEKYKQYWDKRRIDAQIDNESTPMRGIFDVNAKSRKEKQQAAAAE